MKIDTKTTKGGTKEEFAKERRREGAERRSWELEFFLVERW